MEGLTPVPASRRERESAKRLHAAVLECRVASPGGQAWVPLFCSEGKGDTHRGKSVRPFKGMTPQDWPSGWRHTGVPLLGSCLLGQGPGSSVPCASLSEGHGHRGEVARNRGDHQEGQVRVCVPRGLCKELSSGQQALGITTPKGIWGSLDVALGTCQSLLSLPPSFREGSLRGGLPKCP